MTLATTILLMSAAACGDDGDSASSTALPPQDGNGGSEAEVGPLSTEFCSAYQELVDFISGGVLSNDQERFTAVSEEALRLAPSELVDDIEAYVRPRSEFIDGYQNNGTYDDALGDEWGDALEVLRSRVGSQC